MMKLLSIFAMVATFACGAEIKHAVAEVDVPGGWERDPESSDATLVLNSKPGGKQIVVSVLRLQKEAENLDQVFENTKQIFKLRLASVQKLSPDVRFDKAEVSTTESTIVCMCRGFAEKDKVRVAIRIEGTPKTVRSSSVYDYTGQSAEEFQTWSATILAGVK